MLESQIFELLNHCLVYSNHKHTHCIFQYRCLLEQSVLATSSVSESSIFFWHELFKKPFIWLDLMLFLNPATLIRYYSQIWPRIYSLNINSFQLEKFQLKVSQYVCYIIWESHCTKIIVARLLKLTVLYIRIDESVWHPNIEPKFFRTRFVKRLRPAEKFIFQIM